MNEPLFNTNPDNWRTARPILKQRGCQVSVIYGNVLVDTVTGADGLGVASSLVARFHSNDAAIECLVAAGFSYQKTVNHAIRFAP